jgi:hypothetical protein
MKVPAIKLITAADAMLGYSRAEEAPSRGNEATPSLGDNLVRWVPALDVRAGASDVAEAALDNPLSVRSFVTAVWVGTEAVVARGVTLPVNTGSGPVKKLPTCPSART